MIARWTEQRIAPNFRLRLSVRGILARLVAADASYRQKLALEELDDRMLRDMGLTRADVARELRTPENW